MRGLVQHKGFIAIIEQRVTPQVIDFDHGVLVQPYFIIIMIIIVLLFLFLISLYYYNFYYCIIVINAIIVLLFSLFKKKIGRLA